MNAALPLTAALSPLAAEQGLDLTPFALREQAYADMLASARKFDGSYEEAKARFEAIFEEKKDGR